ncbi:hypothetical protein SprV_0301165200 [Sparganum proliferum]
MGAERGLPLYACVYDRIAVCGGRACACDADSECVGSSFGRGSGDGLSSRTAMDSRTTDQADAQSRCVWDGGRT